MASESAPRSAYIHVPFCAHRCGYCNFTLVAGRRDLVPKFLQAIELELQQLAVPRPVDTLYFGGGTPSFLTTDEFTQLATAVLDWHPLGAAYEWTVEANPTDLDDALAAKYAELGVTRISLGAQSFNAAKLKRLERDHRAEDIRRAVRLAHAAGLDVALDLIFAVPSETLEVWRADLEAAIELAPSHVSTYGLTFEKGTSFWSRRARGGLAELDDELQRAMYELAIERLTGAGLEHYEVSNFARLGARSRHNQTYWSGSGYYAAGPGAARYVDGVRETNHRSTSTWLQRVLRGESPVAERETLQPEARARELLVFGLRRLDGVAHAEFRATTGFVLTDLIAAPLEKFLDLGLLENTGDRVRLTRAGLLVSDAIWPDLL